MEKKAVRQLMQELPPLKLLKYCGGGAHADTCKPSVCSVRELWQFRLSYIRLITFTCKETHAHMMVQTFIHVFTFIYPHVHANSATIQTYSRPK